MLISFGNKNTNNAQKLHVYFFSTQIPKIVYAAVVEILINDFFLFCSQWLHPDQITPLCLFFKDMSRELPYLRENDLLYKFYILGAYIVLVAMGIILLLTETQ